MKKVLIFCPYPRDVAPSQRFRFEQYIGLLETNNFSVTFLPFHNLTSWHSLYSHKNSFKKFTTLLSAILRQLFHLSKSVRADYIFIHREILPIGPPVLEWAIAKLLRKKIIYDFDDAIWLTDKIKEGQAEQWLRYRNKVGAICRWSYEVSVGNAYLADYAMRFNKNVLLNPTTIDTDRVHNRNLYPEILGSTQNEGKLIIGWTGSHSTLKYLEQVEDVLKQVQEKYPNVTFLIIADQPPALDLKNLVFKQWSKETEIIDLAQVDIGIMPLPNDEWSKGKCGFKALQFMALEIPCIASPVGVNTKIIQHGINGFLCASGPEWLACFDLLITNKVLHNQIGKAGRKTVEENYSVESNSATFLSLFE